MAETKEQLLKRWESEGLIAPQCIECQPFYLAADPLNVWAPNHRASTRCQSGKRPHCTCDTCF